jgi:hypothetical protein
MSYYKYDSYNRQTMRMTATILQEDMKMSAIYRQAMRMIAIYNQTTRMIAINRLTMMMTTL